MARFPRRGGRACPSPGCSREAGKECAQGHVNGQQLRASQASAERGPEAGPADRGFLLPAPTHLPSPHLRASTSAPRGSMASKRKFLIGHYITGALATAAAGLHRAHHRGSFDCGSPVWGQTERSSRSPEGCSVVLLAGV